LGEKLLEKKGSGRIGGSDWKLVSTKQVVQDSDYVAIYLGGSWCPPCKYFAPHFIQAYKEITRIGKKKLATTFVSADRSEDEFKAYYAQMPWHAVPFTNGDGFVGFDSRTALALNATGIPHLTLFDKHGNILSRSVVRQVYENGAYFLSKLRAH